MKRKRKPISLRQRAAWMLGDLYRLAECMRANGEILNPEPWLKALANILSSAPEGFVGEREADSASEYGGLTHMNLLIALERCGFGKEVTADIMERQITETKTWRAWEAERTGRPHYVSMKPDTIGRLLGITDEIRAEAKAWSIGTFDGSPDQRLKARTERQRHRDTQSRRDKGCLPRAHYEANSLSRNKPWEQEGISRATYYRRLREAGGSFRETSPITPNKVRQVRVRQVQVQPIRVGETGPITPNIIDTQTDAAASGLASNGITHKLRGRYRHPSSLSKRNLPGFRGRTKHSRASEGKLTQRCNLEFEPVAPFTPAPGGLAARLLANAARGESWIDGLWVEEGRKSRGIPEAEMESRPSPLKRKSTA
jgi:hypothetical protein